MMTHEELLDLLREARNALSHGCWNGSCCAVRARIDAALSSPQAARTEGAESKVEWTQVGFSSCTMTADGISCAVHKSGGRWTWDTRIYGIADTEAEAKSAAIAAARRVK